jgi:hypothetical protein
VSEREAIGQLDAIEFDLPFASGERSKNGFDGIGLHMPIYLASTVDDCLPGHCASSFNVSQRLSSPAGACERFRRLLHFAPEWGRLA